MILDHAARTADMNNANSQPECSRLASLGTRVSYIISLHTVGDGTSRLTQVLPHKRQWLAMVEVLRNLRSCVTSTGLWSPSVSDSMYAIWSAGVFLSLVHSRCHTFQWMLQSLHWGSERIIRCFRGPVVHRRVETDICPGKEVKEQPVKCLPWY